MIEEELQATTARAAMIVWRALLERTLPEDKNLVAFAMVTFADGSAWVWMSGKLEQAG